MLGIHANYADGIAVRNVVSQDNNVEHFNYSPVSGGLKITRTRGVTISNSDFLNNAGVGVWLDESVYNATVTGSRMVSNASHGLSFEISSTGVLANNVVTGNGNDGFKINDTDHVRIWNNELSNNGRNIELVQDARRGARLSDPGHDPRQQLPDPTEPWIVSDIQVMNNVIGAPGPSSYEIYARDYSGQYTATQLRLTIDGNRFTKVSSGAEIVWGIANGATAVYTSVVAFHSATGQGANNGEVANGAVQMAVGTSSTLGANPQPLPSDVAAMLGQPAGTRHLGTF
jgi:parallel beta-helix repeat protein